jgi:hypothetical protein
MIIRNSQLTLAVILMSVAISSGCTPAKAPGSNPEDMTPEGHKAAAEEEQKKAAEHEQEKENVGPSKPNAEMDQKAQHEQQAETHKDYAEQHEHAAEAAGGAGGASPSPKKK